MPIKQKQVKSTEILFLGGIRNILGVFRTASFGFDLFMAGCPFFVSVNLVILDGPLCLSIFSNTKQATVSVTNNHPY
jgi:hypothetical protein